MFKLDDVAPCPPGLYEYLLEQSTGGHFVERIADEDFEPGGDHAHGWCKRFTDRCIADGRLPEQGNRNAWATAFYICMYTHGATEAFARSMHELVYLAGGARPDQEPDTKIESIIERTWAGKMPCNPAGSELPRLASQVHDPVLVERAANRGIPRVQIMNGANVIEREIEWLWPGWLSLGKIHLLAGEAGCGKSTLLLSLLATITTGGLWPGSDGLLAPQGSVLVWSGEDNVEDTLMPRFKASGGDPAGVNFVRGVFDPDMEGNDVKRSFDPAHDLPRLLQHARQIKNLKAIMVDPIVSAVTGDSHKNAEVRRALMPLFEFAEESGIAVIGVTHFSKGTMGRDPATRVTGSLAFGAMARVVLAAAKSEDGEKRVLVRAKSNIGEDTGGFMYSLVRDARQRQYVTWGEDVDGTAREIIEKIAPKPSNPVGRPGVKQIETMQWLRALLLANGSVMLCCDVQDRAALDGIAPATLARAREECKDIVTEPNPRPNTGKREKYQYRLTAS